MNRMTIDAAWDYLTDAGIASDETLQLVTNGWGRTLETLETVLYVQTGYRTFKQVMGEG